ncbi:MAG: enoyl-CoA hydratase/isomerase family protein [Acidobacteria bacterium]|nr:enoyl-CoA hydratase/isomerase family protein [Acidobacteriota bacterium]
MFTIAIEGASLVVTFERPPANAINEEWITELTRILDEHETREDLRVVRFRSGLKLFCAGADIDLLADRLASPDGVAKMVDTVRRLQGVFSRIERSPLVSIAEINGVALGGGCEWALSCDIRIAAHTAKIGMPEGRLGLLPAAGGTQRLTKLCGPALARRLILGNEVLDGIDAAALGLVHWSCPPEDLARKAADVAEHISATSKAALAAIKRCIAAAQDRNVEGYELEVDMTRALYQTPEAIARLNEFLSRRKAKSP